MDKVKAASIGLGWVTTHRHLPTMAADKRYEIVGVVDRHPGKAAEIAGKIKCARYSQAEDLGEVPWIGEVDAVVVGTAPHAHYKTIKAALEMGKHVLTEKPFTMTVPEGEELVALAGKNGLKLGIVHNFQFANSTKALVKDIEAGKYGRIRGIHAVQLSNPRRRLPSWYETLPLGLFYDESPHFFYLLSKLAPNGLEFLAGDIYPSSGGLNTPAAVNVKYAARDPQGRRIPVTVNMNFEAPLSEWHIMVYGEELLGDIDVFRDIYISLPNDGLHVTSTVLRTSVMATFQHWMQSFPRGLGHLTGALRYGNETVFGLFAEAVLSGEELDMIGAHDALGVLKMQHEVISKCRRLW
jgi:predicted dehydrogenase